MPGMSGLDLLKQIRSEYPELAVIVITAFGTVETAVEAMRAGAYDYMTKPVNMDELRLIVRPGARAREPEGRGSHTAQQPGPRSTGSRTSWAGPRRSCMCWTWRPGRPRPISTVLIRGETGTGKELLAKAIHFNSPRKDRGFVTINCGAIPKDLIESELFGHVKGSFTGALANKRGMVELADGGTLFLDEIGELPLELQVKILRLIQQGEVAKVGAMRPARSMCASLRQLTEICKPWWRTEPFARISTIA